VPAGRGAFSGELGLIGLFDLGQLLMLNRATGVLSATDGPRRGALYFRDGRIVNAVDDERREGESAAYRIFTWRTGRFEFSPKPVTGDALIAEGTEGLMLEAARRMDEAALGDGRDGGEAGRLAERQDAMAALREEFHAATREARAGARATGGQTALALDALARADDRLLLRPGRPARVRLRGAWRDVRDAALDHAEYAEVRERLLGESAPGPQRACAVLPGGRRVIVECVAGPDGEALWLRPADLPPPPARRLVAAPEQMADLLAMERGMVLVGGEPERASRVLHALVADRLARRPGVLLLAGGDGAYRHAEGAGVLVEVAAEGLAAACAGLQPETLVLEHPAAPPGSLARLAGLRVLMAIAHAGEAEAAFEAWRAGLGRDDAARLDAWLEGAPALWVGALATEAEDDTLPVAVRSLRIGPAAGRVDEEAGPPPSAAPPALAA